MVKLIADYAPHSTRHNGYGYTNSREKVTVHQTGNKSRGADARMHARLQKRLGWSTASWHWQVDDKIGIQSFGHGWSGWHASTRRGNESSIGVEICINADGNYTQSVKNGAYLVAWILDYEGLTVNDVVRHYDWNGKWCPAQILNGQAGINWAKFKQMVKAELDKMQNKQPKKEEPKEKLKWDQFKDLKEGDTATVGTWATEYYGGVEISPWVKGSTYTVHKRNHLGHHRTDKNPTLSDDAYTLEDSRGTIIGTVLAQDIVECQPEGRMEEEIQAMKKQKELVEEDKAVEVEIEEEDKTEDIPLEEGQFILDGKLYEVKEVK